MAYTATDQANMFLAKHQGLTDEPLAKSDDEPKVPARAIVGKEHHSMSKIAAQASTKASAHDEHDYPRVEAIASGKSPSHYETHNYFKTYLDSDIKHHDKAARAHSDAAKMGSASPVQKAMHTASAKFHEERSQAHKKALDKMKDLPEPS